MGTWIAGKGNIPAITTNADSIRAMTDEELAEWINSLDGDNLCPPTCVGCMKVNCKDAWLGWLKQEASE